MRRFVTIVLVLALISVAVTPAAGVASAQANDVDECQNADRGPGDDGPPGFVADRVPGFLSDLIGSLPVPNFVKALFGATAC